MAQQITVAQYLKQRLEELDTEYVFGIAGNYSAAFLNTIEEDMDSPLKIRGNTNEINAGHCADGYSRLSGKIAPVVVTYGVGVFSLLNPVAGSFVEHNRVMVINGAPTFEEQQTQRNQGLLYSHMTGDADSNIDAYRKVTVASEQIKSANEAAAKIDLVVSACYLEGRPVYLEVFEDVWRQLCNAPVSKLTLESRSGNKENTAAAVKATVKMVENFGNKTPLFWAGIELQRQGLQESFAKLVADTHIPYMSTILAKSILPETNDHFVGVYNGKATPDNLSETFNNAGCRIGLGVFNTSKNLGGTKVEDNTMVMAHNQGVTVGRHYFPNVLLTDFIDGLHKELPKVKCSKAHDAMPEMLDSFTKQAGDITYDSFFAAIEDYLTKDHVVVCDAGFPLLGAQNLKMVEQDSFVSSAAWLSIGYSVPASLGVSFAKPDKRTLVFVGDGAFQETCQSISGQSHFNKNNVVFVLNNNIYGIEQLLVNPNPFRTSTDPNDPARKREYPNELLNTVYPYNKLNNWNYEKIVDMVGGKGYIANNHETLNYVFQEINKNPDTNIVVHVQIPELDIPNSISYKLAGTGEDEVNPDL